MSIASPEPNITFWVEAPPHPQPRPQVAVRGGKPMAFTPDKSGKLNVWKRAVKYAVRPFVQADPMGGPVFVQIDYYLPRPASHLATRHGRPQVGHPKPSAPTHHLQKPDLDNLIKSTLDAITEMRLWEDDAQVTQLATSKNWGDQGGASISIQFMED